MITPADNAAIFAACRYTLSGRPLQDPRAVLTRLGADLGAEERNDIYGTGPLVESFEGEIATTLGQEAAVFVPTGTMAQQVALRIWAERAGRKTVLFHPLCHLEIHERKAYQVMHALHAVHTGPAHRILSLQDLEALHEPAGALLLELPQREIGGQLPTWDDLQAQIAWANAQGIAVHMDGARLWESGPYYNRSYAEIAGQFDSVYVSFYKGLGALAGAALAGPQWFIDEARVWIKRHGGSMYQIYPLVLSARLALRERLPLMPAFHHRACEIAALLSTIPGVALKPNPPQTNMMHVSLQGDREQLEARSLDIAREDSIKLFGGLMPTDVPGWSVFELTVLDLEHLPSDDQIRHAFERLVAT